MKNRSSITSSLLFVLLGLNGCATHRAAVIVPPSINFASNECKPEYPRHALRNELQGPVSLSVAVNKEGRIVAADVTESSSHDILDTAVRNTLLNGACRGMPGTSDGQAVDATIKVKYVWRLD
jgi:TonB family protein